MARNPKRAKNRRPPRPRPSGSPDVDDASTNGHAVEPELNGHGPERDDDARIDPAPPMFDSGDAEIADARLAAGAAEADEFDDDVVEADESVDPLLPGAARPASLKRRAQARAEFGEEEEEEPASAAVGAPRVNPVARLVNFVQGSWRELQRVQWPDRRQVMQATGVVIGFVVVAGVFLGASDWLAGKIVNFIIG